jgi:large subunit ribosomal protein L25
VSGDIALWIPGPGGRHNTFATIVGRSSRRFTLPVATTKIMPDSTKLSLTARDPEGSRATRRLRRSGNVPGVIYGGEGEPSHFAVDARILRNTLARSGAILDVEVDGGKAAPVLVKDVQRHPVRGDIMHVDFLRVNMNETIQTTVVIDLVGAETAPGVVEGGVLSQETREVTIEALPGDIPETIQHDVSSMEINTTLALGEIKAPEGVTFVDDLEETVIASITPPTAEPTDDEIETETGLVGADAAAEGQAEGDTAEEAAQSAEDSSDES